MTYYILICYYFIYLYGKAFIQQSLYSAKPLFSKAFIQQSLYSAKPLFSKAFIQQSL